MKKESLYLKKQLKINLKSFFSSDLVNPKAMNWIEF